jgi:hypothetical protein
MARTEVFRVRVSEAEREALDARAAALEVSPSALLRTVVREAIAAPELMASERDAMQDGFRVLRGTANNLNQLARWANEGRSGLGPEVVEEMKVMRGAVEELRAAFGGYLLAEKKRAVSLTDPGAD